MEYNQVLDMANATELTTTVGTLTERVNNHISVGKWLVVVAGFWLVGLSVTLYHINGTISDLARLQADSTPRVVSELLAHPAATSRTDVADELKAASVILNKAKIGRQRPDTFVVQTVATRLLDDQGEYPDMPEVWRTTGDFINYKFAAYLEDSVKDEIKGAYSLSCKDISSGRAGVVFNQCNLDLEGIATGASSATFYKCVVRYRGGPVRIKEMHFLDCVFDVNLTEVPTTDGKIVMKQLARAQDTSKVNAST